MKSINPGLCAASLMMLFSGLMPVAGAEMAMQKLADVIDKYVALGWDKDVKPAALADDAEFFRRVHLDLAGRVPSIVEIRDFLDDPRPEKRRLWVERILQGAADDPSYRDAYSNHFANVWRAWLLAQANPQAFIEQSALEQWLKQRLKANVSYDRMVSELLTQEPFLGRTQNSSDGMGSVSAYYVANELLPENLAASSSRLFLGTDLECAQCHAHPFAKWKREQFWEFAAFFVDVPAPPLRNRAVSKDLHAGIKITGTDKVATARFLDGTAPTWKDNKTRPTLAAWLTAPSNTLFTRAAVQRLWTYFFGMGLVEQLESAHDAENNSQIALLDELARAFAASRYDLKFLIRAITASQAYQRTSAVDPGRQSAAKQFARMPLRGLSPEQLFDSLAVATECAEAAFTEPNDGLILGPQSPRAQFVAKFPNQDQKTDYQTSILQALYLMNNDFITRQTSARVNQTLATLAAQETSNERKVESLYLVVLARKPRREESDRFVNYLTGRDAKTALADVFWVLLNSPEFLLNH
jgi:hypothetical protein